jgi:RNA polymerase sigma-54 factor
MALGPRLDIRQTQALVLTPQLQQAIRLLQLSNLELEAVIAEEMAKNPLLESAGGDDEGAPQAEAPDEIAIDSSEEPAAPGADELMLTLDGTNDQPLDFDWNNEALETDSFTDVVGSSGAGEDDGPDFERMEYSADSLAEHLQNQLHGASGQVGDLARAIAEMLEDTGYLPVSVRDIAEATGAPVTVVEQALALVQDLDPAGVGARNLAECLALQAKAVDRYDPAMARLFDNLDLLAKGRMADLKRICGVDDEDLADMVRELRAYDPKPGCQFSDKGVDSVTPDVFIRRTRSGYAVELNTATLPRLLVNRRYYQELKSGPSDKNSRAWLSECLASANWLVKALDQRARTIVKVVSEIVKRQQGFFEKGVAAMKPMTLREIAEAIEMHESTISRVTSNKYVLCDRGLFELKYFFTTAINGTAGEAHSAEAVRHRIRALILAEHPDRVLSDDAIVEALRAEGVDIARRTVAKYREALRIPSSVQRKREKAASV